MRFSRSLQKGFTLIELLVVIGILGILAAALVATINPFEQLNKADDAKVKNAAVEFNTAALRYYTTHGAFPWDTDDADCAGGLPSAVQLSSTAGDACLQALINDGELKAAFADADDVTSSLYLSTQDANDLSPVVCFQPVSQAEQNTDLVQYDRDGTENATKNCDLDTADSGCYWCSR